MKKWNQTCQRLCVGLVGLLLAACSPSPPSEPTPSIAFIAQPTATPPPTEPAPPRSLRVLLPRWIDGEKEQEVLRAIAETTGSPEAIRGRLDDQTIQRDWDVALIPSHAGIEGASREWVVDRLRMYINSQRFAALGVAAPPGTWGELLLAAKTIPPASRDHVLAMPTDPLGLVQSFHAVTLLLGATSQTPLDGAPVARASDLFRDLVAAGLFSVQAGMGETANAAADRMARGEAALGLFWDVEGGWVTDPAVSPSAARLARANPASFDLGQVPEPERTWCWVIHPNSGLGATDSLLESLASLSPPSVLERADPSTPGEGFDLEFRPGQDHRITQRLLVEGWRHGQRGVDLLRGLEFQRSAMPRPGGP